MDVNFTKNAQGLSRNPLGIIALFLSLIYVLACLVLGVTQTNLESNEKLPLIWFVVLFPVCILGSFMVLVIYHHTKLYAPVDFRDDSNFLVSAKMPPSLFQSSPEQVVDQPSVSINLQHVIEEMFSTSSLIGLFAIKMVVLSVRERKGVQFDDFERINPSMVNYYCYGFLVAFSSTGAFDFVTQNNFLSFKNLHEYVAVNIDAAIESTIERIDESARDTQRKCLSDIEDFFTATNY